jgi:hypothetical protein
MTTSDTKQRLTGKSTLSKSCSWCRKIIDPNLPPFRTYGRSKDTYAYSIFEGNFVPIELTQQEMIITAFVIPSDARSESDDMDLMFSFCSRECLESLETAAANEPDWETGTPSDVLFPSGIAPSDSSAWEVFRNLEKAIRRYTQSSNSYILDYEHLEPGHVLPLIGFAVTQIAELLAISGSTELIAIDEITFDKNVPVNWALLQKIVINVYESLLFLTNPRAVPIEEDFSHNFVRSLTNYFYIWRLLLMTVILSERELSMQTYQFAPDLFYLCDEGLLPVRTCLLIAAIGMSTDSYLALLSMTADQPISEASKTYFVEQATSPKERRLIRQIKPFMYRQTGYEFLEIPFVISEQDRLDQSERGRVSSIDISMSAEKYFASFSIDRYFTSSMTVELFWDDPLSDREQLVSLLIAIGRELEAATKQVIAAWKTFDQHPQEYLMKGAGKLKDWINLLSQSDEGKQRLFHNTNLFRNLMTLETSVPTADLTDIVMAIKKSYKHFRTTNIPQELREILLQVSKELDLLFTCVSHIHPAKKRKIAETYLDNNAVAFSYIHKEDMSHLDSFFQDSKNGLRNARRFFLRNTASQHGFYLLSRVIDMLVLGKDPV